MLKVLFIGSSMLFVTSIYTYKISGINSNEIDFNDFRNKKILIVNIATGSPQVGQLQKLEQLYQLYKDSLVLIAFPSGSFGNEPRNNNEIKAFCENMYSTTFLIAEKNPVAGETAQPIYQWLSSPSENGVLSGTVSRDFQKFLIDRNGSLIGAFDHSVDPMDSLIQNAVTGNQ